MLTSPGGRGIELRFTQHEGSPRPARRRADGAFLARAPAHGSADQPGPLRDPFSGRGGSAVAEGVGAVGTKRQLYEPLAEGEAEEAEAGAVARLGVARAHLVERHVVVAAGADDEFAHAVRDVELAGRALGCEALVVVVVAIDDEVRAGTREIGPDRAHLTPGASWPEVNRG